MQPIINQIHKLLTANQKTVAAAESCTAGLLSYLLTQRPGSSKYFVLGVSTYSNTAKTRLLKIPSRLIAKKGAVSRDVALEMARSVRKLARADFGVAITGIAGPSGGTLKKPVGTVFIAVSSRRKTVCEKWLFKGSRTRIRIKSSLKALGLLKREAVK